jgi:hypothetical protein
MVVRSAAQRKQSKLNGSRSRGPLTAHGKEKIKFNALRSGCRAVSLILPGELADQFANLLDALVDVYQPRDTVEYLLVHDIARADWVKQRMERSQFERSKAYIEAARDREDLDVEADLAKLFAHPAGPIQLWGVTRPAFDVPATSATEKCEDPDRPLVVRQRLQGSAKGCEALLGNWRAIQSRVQGGLEIQAPDRLKAIRMLGLDVLSAYEDRRVALILVASFALQPKGRDNPYEDYKSDLSTPEVAAFAERVRKQWGLVLDGADAPAAREAFLDLISRNIELLEAKLEVHQQHTDEQAASIKWQKAWDESPLGQQLARHVLAVQRSAQRARDALYKHRREMERWIDDGVVTVEGENLGDLNPELAVAEPASNGPEANLTNEPEAVGGVAKVTSLKEVTSSHAILSQAAADLRLLRELGVAGFLASVAGDGTVPAADEQAILGGGPLLRPNT